MCSLDQIQRYRAKISGPLLDRIDMHVLVDAVPYRDFISPHQSTSSAVVRQRVMAARARQRDRGGPAHLNANLRQEELDAQAPVTPDVLLVIERAMDEFGLSTRAVNRLRKVACTVADLAGAPEVMAEHLQEALSFRVLGRGELGQRAAS